MMTAYDIIKKPVLTEKSYDGVANKVYTFEVDLKATKTQIKNALAAIYPEVTIESVNTMITRGKRKSTGPFGHRAKNPGVSPKIKKAIVKLSKDSKAIAAFEA